MNHVKMKLTKEIEVIWFLYNSALNQMNHDGHNDFYDLLFFSAHNKVKDQYFFQKWLYENKNKVKFSLHKRTRNTWIYETNQDSLRHQGFDHLTNRSFWTVLHDPWSLMEKFLIFLWNLHHLLLLWNGCAWVMGTSRAMRCNFRIEHGIYVNNRAKTEQGLVFWKDPHDF